MRRLLKVFISRWRAVRAQGARTGRLRDLRMLLRPYRVRIAWMFFALLIATLAALAPPLLAKIAIDDGIAKRDESVLVLVVVLYLISALINWGATYAQTYLTGWVGQRALQDLRVKLFDHMQSLSVGFHSERKTGVLVSRLTNDIQALDQLVTDGVITLFGSTVTLVGIVAILLSVDVPLALATFSILPLVLLGSFIFRVISAEAYRTTRERIAAVSSYLQETISGVQVVRSYGQEGRHIEQFALLNEDNRAANMKTVNLNAAYFPVVELLSAVGTAIILIYGGSRALDGDLTVGALVLFVGYLQAFFDPIQQLSQLYTTYQAGMAALDKIFELLATKPDLTDRPNAFVLDRIEGRVELEDVSFSYAEGGPLALDRVSLSVQPGQTVAFVGETGAGKSTMAKLIARFYDPQVGRILIDGHDLRDINGGSLRRQLGYVPQEGYLFSGTVADNISFGRPDASRDEIEHAARAVGAHEMIAGLSDGYDTTVGERGGQLSAGQRQLVAFARAIIANPRLLILDEATASVDIATEMRIEQGLKELLQGRTAFVIAHRLSTIQDASRIVVIDHGRIAETGTHDELLAAGGRYFALYAAWNTSAA